MTEKVLVVTPYVALGRLIRQSLEHSAYEVQVTESADDALELAAQVAFSVAILDADVADLSIVDLGQSLVTDYPDLRLVVIPPNNDPDSPLLDGLSPHAFLSKPFYLPDLLQTIESLLSGNLEGVTPLAPDAVSSQSLPGETDPFRVLRPWYEDPSQTFDHLACISLGPGVHEAIITCAGELWAYVGQLAPEAAAELAATTIRYWEEGENGDLARFVSLKSNGSQYFLYATRLLGTQVLSLIYDSNMPFSRIRSQSNQLARSLIVSSSMTLEAALISRPSISTQAPVEDLPPSTQSLDDLMPTDSDLPPLFDDIPSPDPVFKDLSSIGWVKEENGEPGIDSFTEPVEPPMPASNPTVTEKLDFPSPAQSQPDFEPMGGVISNLVYTAVLIPRLPHHLLKEELAAQLKRWMPQLSLAFGWNLEDLVIDPGYMKWAVRLSPEVAPTRMVEAVRQNTSLRIFTAFTGLAKENPSGDFWASDFIIASGAGVLPPETLHDFLTQVREHQTAAEF
jgi:CheY-like chemotaxis protein/REP element-mobilizing transposase RayT